MQKSKENQGSIRVKLADGLKRITCQGSKKRTGIYVNSETGESDFPKFEKIPRMLLSEFELGHHEGSFEDPTNTEKQVIFGDMNSRHQSRRQVLLRTTGRQSKQIYKQEVSKPVLRYKQIRLMIHKYGDTIKGVAELLKMSTKTIRKILMKYKDPQNRHEELDEQIIVRSKSHKKYPKEEEYIKFIQEVARNPSFDRLNSVSFIINKMHGKFGAEKNFKRTTVYSWMKKAGLKYRKAKYNIRPNKNEFLLNQAQQFHLWKMSKAIFEKKMLIFLDETYVSNQTLPTKLWFLASEDPKVNIKPKEHRATIVAACSMKCWESFQVIFDSIDSVHYAIFLLTLHQQLSEKYRGFELVFIYDNARAHIGRQCRELFSELPFVRQPAYSPQLNLIEYAFSHFKREYRKQIMVKDRQVSQEQLVFLTMEKVGRVHFNQARWEFHEFLLKKMKNEIL